MENYKTRFINRCLLKYLNKEEDLYKNIKFLYKRIENWKKQILLLITKERKENKKIYGYGASGRTNTILSYLDISFDNIFDDSKYKIGNYTPFYHIKILNSEKIYELKIETIFILAWPYSKDIIKKHKKFIKNKGKFYVILPEIKEININNYNDFI